MAVAHKIVALYETLSRGDSLTAESDAAINEPEILRKANLFRKQIEASEQHRTMCVEHGLGDAAIDATYEIQAMEKQLVDLIQTQ